MSEQNRLRKQVRLIKAEYKDLCYKDFADYINISTNSFYNWLNGYYDLSLSRKKKLEAVIVDLLD